MTRVLLVDDQQLVREGLRRILETRRGISVVGECEDGDQVVDEVARCRPTVVLMDLRMRRVGGAEATRRLRRLGPTPPVLVLTTFDDAEAVDSALSAGAAGFLLKDAPGEDIVRATLTVAEGKSWLDPNVTAQVLEGYRQVAGGQRQAQMVEGLTQRELDVLRAVGRGATNAEVARALSISEATVKTHLGHIMVKLGLRDRAAAIILAHDRGLV
jgi:DNA-binding NarL/FixJ family response regulator